MKKFLFLLIFLTGTYCSAMNSNPPLKKIIIAGKVLNPDPDIFKVDVTVNRIGFKSDRTILSQFIDNDGTFKVTFESYVPTDVWIMYKTNFLVLTHPGDSIYVEFDGSKNDRPDILKTISFSGDDADINYEAAKFQQMYFSSTIYTDWDRKHNAIKNYDDIKYKQYRDSLRNEEKNLFNRFVEEYNPAREVRIWASTYLDAEYYVDLYLISSVSYV